MWRRLLGLLIMTNCLTVQAAQSNQWKNDWWLASQSPQQATPSWLAGDAKTAPISVPLGSLWKLIVYSYSIDQGLPDKPYQCHAGKQAAAGDEYCCSQNEIIGRDTALARSCGAYFEPERLQIDAANWQQYWQKKAPDIKWLHTLNNMQPQTQSTVPDILTTLNRMPPTSIAQSRQALLGRLLQPQWSALLPQLGGAYRFKTFTWQHPQYAGAYFGGAAGWLADGTAFWLGGTGSSKEVLLKAAPILAQRLPLSAHSSHAFGEECVAVHYFKRYPVQQIQSLDKTHIPIANGTLRGQYIVKFENGNALKIQSNGELSLSASNGKSQIWGKMGLQEYLARVIDREADAKVSEAAKALSIAARSYLYQNAHFHQGCWQIDDDSHTQRVSPNPASAAASAVVAFTEGLSLTGEPIYYHQNKTSVNTLNWQAAVNSASQGENYLALLHEAYPNASWRLGNQEQQCQHVPNAENYVQRNSTAAQRILKNTAGFESVKGLKVCALDYGNPYADQQTMSIYLRDWRNENDRITLWHEYLHLALRFHPNGKNEDYVETLARQLAHALTFDLALTNAHNQPVKRMHHAQ
jgi:uncharacterized protein YfaQ (DUF2300 family)